MPDKMAYYKLSKERYKELAERRKQFGILSDWYGEDYARTEISAHTKKPQHIGLAVDEIFSEIKIDETNYYVDLAANWKNIAGAVSGLASPSGMKDGILYLSVRHSALVRELNSVSELLIQQINKRYGDGFCREIRLK